MGYSWLSTLAQCANSTANEIAHHSFMQGSLYTVFLYVSICSMFFFQSKFSRSKLSFGIFGWGALRQSIAFAHGPFVRWPGYWTVENMVAQLSYRKLKWSTKLTPVCSEWCVDILCSCVRNDERGFVTKERTIRKNMQEKCIRASSNPAHHDGSKRQISHWHQPHVGEVTTMGTIYFHSWLAETHIIKV